ncbi:MAG: cation diffusion facilitator family transporter [Christensenellales bacterium]|jgi:cation diffusion facilitator family transporter
MRTDEPGRRVALVGIAGNLALLAVKAAAGIITGSQAMLADAINSTGDVFSSLMTYIGSRVAGMPEDRDHPFGHGKSEFIFSFIIGLSMLVGAVAMVRSAVIALVAGEVTRYSAWLPAVAVGTIAMKAYLFFYTRRKYAQTESLLIRANMEDHRNDCFVSLGTLTAALGSLVGLFFLDGVFGILIALWIGITGVRILVPAFRVLMDTQGIDDVFRSHLESHVLEIPGVDHIDTILAKPTGARYILIVKVSVPGGMTVNESHVIAGKIKAALRSHREIADCVVHINPA